MAAHFLIGVCVTSVFNATRAMSVHSCVFPCVVIKTHQIVRILIGVLTSFLTLDARPEGNVRACFTTLNHARDNHHKINPGDPFRYLLCYVIPDHFILAESHRYPTIPCGPCFRNRDFFYYADCMFQL